MGFDVETTYFARESHGIPNGEFAAMHWNVATLYQGISYSGATHKRQNEWNQLTDHLFFLLEDNENTFQQNITLCFQTGTYFKNY